MTTNSRLNLKPGGFKTIGLLPLLEGSRRLLDLGRDEARQKERKLTLLNKRLYFKSKRKPEG